MKEHYLKTSLNRWKMQPQECPGTYMFNGSPIITSRIQHELEYEDILSILQDINNYLLMHGGADYLFVFKSGDKKIFVIDNLNTEMKKDLTNEFIQEHNYFTILFADEY
jgi:hypothetical protein